MANYWNYSEMLTETSGSDIPDNQPRNFPRHADSPGVGTPPSSSSSDTAVPDDLVSDDDENSYGFHEFSYEPGPSHMGDHPGPSREPQPGPSREPQRGHTHGRTGKCVRRKYGGRRSCRRG